MKNIRILYFNTVNNIMDQMIVNIDTESGLTCCKSFADTGLGTLTFEPPTVDLTDE